MTARAAQPFNSSVMKCQRQELKKKKSLSASCHRQIVLESLNIAADDAVTLSAK